MHALSIYIKAVKRQKRKTGKRDPTSLWARDCCPPPRLTSKVQN